MQIPILALLMFAAADNTGPAVGTAVLPFSLQDQNGATQTLKSILVQKARCSFSTAPPIGDPSVKASSWSWHGTLTV